jgi:hypothetical protein
LRSCKQPLRKTPAPIAFCVSDPIRAQSYGSIRLSNRSARPNTYESSSVKRVEKSRAAVRCGREGVASVRARHRTPSWLRSAVQGVHPTRIEAHVHRRPGAAHGKTWSSPRPRSSSGPSCRPPHDVDLVLVADPWSPGSGKGRSRKRPSARALTVSERKRGRSWPTSSGAPPGPPWPPRLVPHRARRGSGRQLVG